MAMCADHYLRLSVLSLLAGIFALSGCASLNEKECQTADWRMIGYEDGTVGRSTIQLKDHRKACAKHGITPDLDAYRQGHEAGLVEYCHPVKAYQLGKGGNAYPRLCPAEKESALRPAYRDGKKVYELQSVIRKTQQRLSGKQRELKEITQTLNGYQAEIISKGTTSDRRRLLLAETVRLSKREDEIHDQIAVLEQKLQARKKNLKRLESKLAY